MRAKTLHKSNHKGVFLIQTTGGEKKWLARHTINGYALNQEFDTEVEAARAVDISRVRGGKSPVNVIKEKQ